MTDMWDQFAKADAAAAPASGVWDQFERAPAPNTLSDIAKSGGIGLVKGMVGLAGLPGDIAEYGARGIDYATRFVGDKLGVDVKPRAAQDPAYGSADIQKAIEGVTGEFYQPQTTAGKYAQTAGEFLPAMIGGPETMAAKLISRVAVPAAVSEGAGQATEGTALEPAARIAGAVTGAIAGHRLTKPAVADALPTAAQIKDAARAGYQHPEVAALEINPAALTDAANRTATTLIKDGYRPVNTPQTFSAVNDLRTPAGAPAKAADVQAVQKNLQVMSREVNAIGKPTPEAAAASVALREIGGFLENLKPTDVLSGNAARTAALLREASANWAAASKAEDVGARLTRAERQAAKAGSGSNIDNAIRQKVSAILDVPSRTVGYKPDEIAQMEKIVRGTVGSNVARKIGKLGFGDGLSLLLHAGATLPTGGANIPIGIAGTVARKIGEHITQRNAVALEEMIRGRSPEAARWRAAQARIAASNPQRLSYAQSGMLGAALGLPGATDASRELANR